MIKCKHEFEQVCIWNGCPCDYELNDCLLYEKEITCENCNTIVKEAPYETGMEAFCKCQCTLDANWNPKLWEGK